MNATPAPHRTEQSGEPSAAERSTTDSIARFIDANPELPTPYLVVDLDVVAERYEALAEALDGVALHYAVKANPAPEVLSLVLAAGGRFDVASPGEIDLCLAVGATGDQISYGNTAKKDQVAQDSGTLAPALDQDYCWMWSNKTPAPVLLKLTLKR